MADQSLLLEFSKHSQRFLNGSLRWLHNSSDPKVDDIQSIESEISEIVVNSVDHFSLRKSMNPRLVFTTASAHFGDNHQPIRVRMEHPLNDLIRHMRTVKVAGIDMIHARRNRLTQDTNRSVNITWRSPDLRAG